MKTEGFNIRELVEKLILSPSISGFETEAREKISSILISMGMSVESDVMGNLYGIKRGGEKYKLMLAAHMDQIGIMVTNIDEKGFLYFSSRSFDPRVIYGQKVTLYTEKGNVNGVIGAKAIHLTKPEEREKAVRMEDMYIDIGANSKEDVLNLGIRPGTVGTTTPYLSDLINGKASGVGLDDKAGVAAILYATYLALSNGINGELYTVATVQEEVGLRGAITSSYNVKPDIAIAVDVTHSVSPGIDPNLISGVELGKGPVIGIGPNFHPKMWEKLEEVAKESNIPYQLEALPNLSGTDAAAIQVSRGGVITGLVSIPLRYMHSPVEVVSLSDIENASKLIAKFIEKLNSLDWRKTFSF
ncbi:MAG: M42 family metallopeptidase [Candidatus Brockarchaeota archaeon]|nr:M42 family metallopeptidase [Candidatus Brockarchaeota archaeon]